jgi:hypothetical protein
MPVVRQCPSYPCVVVGRSGRGDILMATRKEAAEPTACISRFLFDTQDDGSCAVDSNVHFRAAKIPV